MRQSVQKPQTHVVYLLIAILSAFALLAMGFYEGSAWKSFSGKSLWDWLTILLPLIVLLIIMVLIFARPRLRSHQILQVQHKWRVFWITGLVTLSVIFIILVIGGYRLGWTWTGFSDNKLWDWLDLLILPVTLSIAPQWFNLYLPQSQSKQQVRPKWRIMWIALLIVLLTAFTIVVVGGYRLGWTWTGFSRKTVWDWIHLLVVPFSLMLATIFFSKLQKQLQMTAQASATNQVQQGAGYQQVDASIAPQQLAPSGKSPKPARWNSLITWQGMVLIIVTILFLGGTVFRLSSIFAKPLTPPPVVPPVVIANGMMLGYNAQHTRVDPNEKIITPDNFSSLQEKWSRPTGGTIMSSPTEANGIVYISSNGNTHVIKENGYFYAFYAKTGVMVWMPVLIGSNDAGNAPTVANGVVYMGAPDKYLYAFYASTGKLKWKKPTGGRIGSSPTLVDGVIYIGSDDGYLYAFRASNGDQLKKISVSPNFPIYSSPAVSTDGKTVYVGSDYGDIYAIDISSYTVKWLIRTGSPVRSTPAVYKNVIYVGSDDGYLYAINPGGSLAWKSLTGGKIDSSPAVYNGVVYVGSDDGYLYAFNANPTYCERQICKPSWHHYPGGSRQPIQSSPTIANGVLFIGSDDGYLYAYNISGCKSTSCIPNHEWSYLVAGTIDSSPVVENGYVYIGSDDKNDPNNGYLYAFGL